MGADLAQIKKYLVVYIYPPVPLANKKNLSFTFRSMKKEKLTILTFFFYYFLAWAMRLYILSFPC